MSDKIKYIMNYKNYHGYSQSEVLKMSSKQLDNLIEFCCDTDNENQMLLDSKMNI